MCSSPSFILCSTRLLYSFSCQVSHLCKLKIKKKKRIMLAGVSLYQFLQTRRIFFVFDVSWQMQKYFGFFFIVVIFRFMTWRGVSCSKRPLQAQNTANHRQYLSATDSYTQLLLDRHAKWRMPV